MPARYDGPGMPAQSGELPIVSNHSKELAVATKGSGKGSVAEQIAEMFTTMFNQVNTNSLNVVADACTRNAERGFEVLSEQFREMMRYQSTSSSSSTRRRPRPRTRSPRRYGYSRASSSRARRSRPRQYEPTSPAANEDCRAPCKCRAPGPPRVLQGQGPPGDLWIYCRVLCKCI